MLLTLLESRPQTASNFNATTRSKRERKKKSQLDSDEAALKDREKPVTGFPAAKANHTSKNAAEGKGKGCPAVQELNGRRE